MKKLALLALFLQSCLFAAPRVSYDLQHAYNVASQSSDVRKIVAEVEKDGPFSIYSAPFQSVSNAKWMPDDRCIVLNTLKPRSLGESIRSIVFELHNAQTSKEFDKLDAMAWRGQISRQNYILSVERMEHQNALRTRKILDSAMRAGLFPADCYWEIPDSFQSHMDMQNYSGHSAAIGQLYDQLRQGSYS